MLNRLRRFAGVLLALALLPAAGGAAQCVEHGDSAHAAEDFADTEARSHEHGAFPLTDAAADHSGAESASHNHYAMTSQTDRATSVHESASAVMTFEAVHVAHVTQVAHAAPDGCCPPAGMPGECSSAMGCSVMSATPDQRSVAPLQPIARVIVADGVQQSPGPSRAPEVPPPRS